MNILGIDIGGSGIKGAIVNTKNGELVSDRYRIPTPAHPIPNSVAQSIGHIIKHFNWQGQVGCSFPTKVINGECKSAGNIGEEWIDINLESYFSARCIGTQFNVANDADLAGIAEMKFGTGKELYGKVMMVTIGTGIGTALFNHGQLVSNLEFGRVLYTDGRPIEFYAADSARKRDNLKLKEWSARFNTFLEHTTRITSPDSYIIGGGISKKFNKFKDYLSAETPIYLASFGNNAGIVGAALFAEQKIVK